MAGKVYVVRRGRTTGILTTWSDCLESVKGFPGASFKSFSTREAAERWLNEEDLIVDINDIPLATVCAYTDGSYNGHTKRTAYGVWIPALQYSELIDTTNESCTNNYNEIRAILAAVTQFSARGMSGVVVTDSEYAIMAISEYVIEWERHGELMTRPNGTMIWRIRELLIQTKSRLAHIRSHQGGTDRHSLGNDRVDVMVQSVTQR
jgi:ribonuclease HI